MGSGDTTKEQDRLDKILAELAEHRAILNGLANQTGAMRAEISSMKTQIGSLDTRLTSVENRLTSLEERFEKKLLETKPIWVAELSDRIDKSEATLRAEMQKGFREISIRMQTLAGDVIEVSAYQRDLEERLGNLEHPVRSS